MFFTEKEIRTAIDHCKVLKQEGSLQALQFELRKQQPYIHEFIFEYLLKIINKNERFCIEDFATWIYVLFLNETVNIPIIKREQLLFEYNRCLKLDVFNIYLTECELVEDYLKPIIHANEWIKPRFTKQVICASCAILNCFYLNTKYC